MRRVVLLLFVLLTQACVTSYAQSRQTSLGQIDQEFQLYRKGADERIQKYLHKNPQALVSFKRNNAVYLMVDVSESGVPLFERTDNAQEATSVNVPALRTGGSLGINILGTGIRLGTWDGGRVRNDHIELIGRVTQVDGAASFDDHTTHVTGTMMATGINATAKGMAPEATLSAFDFNNDVTEMTSQAKPDQTTLLLSNHSYGNVAGWESSSSGSGWTWNGDPTISTTVDYKFGFYDTKANQWDAIAVSAPYYTIVKSAGNDRSDVGDGTRPPDGAPNGYDCIPTFGVAKNIITVGAVQNVSSYTGPSDVLMTSFSSWGPTDDGRIKPDIVAPGSFVFSTLSTSTNAYGNLSGTSMSTPVVTGTLSLLQQLYKSLNSGNFMRSATVKALILHTAREAGANPGPDYAFGWGLLDAGAAAKLIINRDNQNTIIREAILTSGQPFEITLTPKANEKITATLVWTDPAGIPPPPSVNPTNRMLVNDLDLRLVDDGGASQFPWILDPASPAAAATRGDNIRDNVEKIEFATPQPRTYKLRVTNKGTLVGATQPFSIIVTYVSLVDPLVTYFWIPTPQATCPQGSNPPQNTDCRGSGNWNNPAHWSRTSGGLTAGAVPGANDRVVFDENSFTADNQVVNLTDSHNCFSIRWFAKELVNFSLSSNTLSVGESMTFITDKVTTSTPGTISLNSTSPNPNSVDLDANNFTNWNLNFTGSSSWAITGSASVNQLNVSQGTVTFTGSNLRLNQLIGTGTSAKTMAFTGGATLRAAQGLNADFTGITLQSDSLSSIIALPSVINSINFPNKNFNGIIFGQGGDISIAGSGQLRSLQGNGVFRLNGSFQVSRLNLSGGSQLVAQQGSTQTFTDKIIFATSASSRVALRSSGTQPAQFTFTDYYKLCFDNIDVTSVNILGNSIVNAGPGGTLTTALGWVKADCSDLVFPDFTVSNACVRSSVYFTDKSSGPISSRSWNFGDPASGTNNTSSLVNPLHFYATNGPFTATLTVTGPAGSRPISKTIMLATNALGNNTVQMNNGNLISSVLAPSYQWLKDGQIIPGATSRSYDFNFNPGEYSVLIFNETCNRRSDPFLITAIEDDSPAPSQVVKLYPNPTSEVLQIESANDVLSLSILDAMGREFRSSYEKTDKTRYRVDVSAVPSGLYIVKLSTSLKTEVLKLVIRK